MAFTKRLESVANESRSLMSCLVVGSFVDVRSSVGEMSAQLLIIHPAEEHGQASENVSQTRTSCAT